MAKPLDEGQNRLYRSIAGFLDSAYNKLPTRIIAWETIMMGSWSWKLLLHVPGRMCGVMDKISVKVESFVVLPALKKSGHQERKFISPRDDRTFKILLAKMSEFRVSTGV